MELRSIVEIKAGYPIRGEIKPQASGSISLVQRRDVNPEYGLSTESLVHIDLPGKKKPDFLQSNDILFVGRVERQRKPYAVLLKVTPPSTIAAPQFFIIRPNTKQVSALFLTWYLNEMAQPFLAKHAVGTSLLNIPRRVLETLPINLPPLTVQQNIAKLYDAQCREKHLSKALLEKKRLLADAVMKRCMTQYN